MEWCADLEDKLARECGKAELQEGLPMTMALILDFLSFRDPTVVVPHVFLIGVLLLLLFLFLFLPDFLCHLLLSTLQKA